MIRKRAEWMISALEKTDEAFKHGNGDRVGSVVCAFNLVFPCRASGVVLCCHRLNERIATVREVVNRATY